MENEFISVMEASQMVGKSTSSIYRAIEQHGKEGEAKKIGKRQMVSRDFIRRVYPVEAKRAETSASGTTGMEVERLWGEIEFLRSQLEAKDGQIETLNQQIKTLLRLIENGEQKTKVS